MKFDFSNTKIFIRPGSTKFNQSKDAILFLIRDVMKQNPMSGAVFLFCSRNRKTLKAIWWDGNGFWISTKKLEVSRWPWPKTKEDVRELSFREINHLLAGVDFFNVETKVKYRDLN